MQPDSDRAAKPAKLAPLQLRDEGCTDDHPIVELQYVPRGSVSKKVRLEAKSGAFIGALAGWTGESLLEVNENGAVTRRGCNGVRLGAPAPPPTSSNAILWEKAENIEQTVYCSHYPVSLMSIVDQGHPHGSLVYKARGNAKHSGNKIPQLEFSIMAGPRAASAYLADNEAEIRGKRKGTILAKNSDATGYVLDWREGDVIHRTRMWLMPSGNGVPDPDHDFVFSDLEYPADEDAIWAPVADRLRGESPTCPR